MRDDSVSIAKGIAIILMVLAHARFSVYGQNFINMFHMPLFFFFSGYCFKEKYLTDAKGFAIKRFMGVYFPFVKWSLLFLLLHNVFFYLNIYNDEYGFCGKVSHLYTIPEFFNRALHITTALSGNEQLLGGYWFLHSLFFGAFLFYGVLKLCNRPIFGGVFLLVTCFISLYIKKGVPYFGIGARELLAAAFMVAGFAYKKYGCRWHNRPVLIPFASTLIITGSVFWQCEMISLTWQKVIPYTISSLAGTLMVFSISTFVIRFNKLKRLIVFIGNHTLEILTWHFLCFKLVSLLIVGVYSLPIEQLAEFPVIEEYAYAGWWTLYLIVGVSLPLLMKKLTTKINVKSK